MEKQVYEKRARQLDDIITDLYEDIRNYVPSEDDNNRKPVSELCKLIEAENRNAQILLDIDTNILNSRKQDLDEQVSYEKHETDLKALDIRKDELDAKKQEINIKEREVECRALEVKNASKEIDRKVDSESKKLDVEEKAVFGRVIGEGVKVFGIFIGGVLTIVALRGAMEFEKIENGGGVIPSKLLNLIFRIPTR